MRLLEWIGAWFDFGPGESRSETRSERLRFRLFELIVIFWVLRLVWVWGTQIPDADYTGAASGLANYLDLSFLRSNGLSLLNAGIVSIFAVAGLIRILRPAYAVVLVLMHVQYSALFGMATIDHASHVIGMCMLGLSIAAIAFKSGPNRRRFALGFAWLSMGFGYTVSAATKVIASGPRWVEGNNLWTWINERTTDLVAGTGEFELNVLQQLLLDNWWLATGALTLGLVCQATGFFLWFRRARHYQAAALLVVHAGAFLALGISAQPAMWLLALFAVPWALVREALRRRR